MSNVTVLDHPLIQHKVGIIRRKEVGTRDFRSIISEIAGFMCYEATRDLKLKDVEIETPICKAVVKELSGRKLAVVPVLRAGLGMVDGILNLIPAAKVGHIGLYRDPETLEPVEYYCKLPADCDEREVFVVDPMLATGGSASAAITLLKEHGCRHIRLMNIIAAPVGVERLQKDHPDVDTGRCRRPYFRYQMIFLRQAARRPAVLSDRAGRGGCTRIGRHPHSGGQMAVPLREAEIRHSRVPDAESGE